MYVKCNFEGPSCNNCCSGKAISITYSECGFVALVIQHAKRMHPIVICGLSGSTIFLHIISNDTIFFKKSHWTWNVFISVFNQLDAQNLFHNKFYFMPLHVSSTCAHQQEVKTVLHSLWYTQFWPPDDERMCSKHVEAWNKTYCETNFVHQVG